MLTKRNKYADELTLKRCSFPSHGHHRRNSFVSFLVEIINALHFWMHASSSRVTFKLCNAKWSFCKFWRNVVPPRRTTYHSTATNYYSPSCWRYHSHDYVHILWWTPSRYILVVQQHTSRQRLTVSPDNLLVHQQHSVWDVWSFVNNQCWPQGW